jgi:aspartyl-tRNA(Asn)/glutamyl-tRNA(Gln) amidotransferase subunit A
MGKTTEQLELGCIAQASEAIQARSISARELTQHFLERIDHLNDKVGALSHVDHEGALQAARSLDEELTRGINRGPLHGIPVILKENIETQGLPTTNGSRIFENRRSTYDATVWKRLRSAGMVLLGKARMHEAAWGVDVPPVGNPWDLTRSPGVSSSGSGAAVAAGFCYAALGTDTGGSVRIPAAACGVVGLKPTYGRVSKFGVFTHSWSLDNVGPLTRRVKDAAAVIQVLAGFDQQDAATARQPVPDFSVGLKQGVKRLRVGIPQEYFFDRVEPEVEATVHKAIKDLEELGAELLPVSIPHMSYGLAAILAIELASVSCAQDSYINNEATRSLYTREVRILMEEGRFILATDYLKAERLRALLEKEMQTAFESVDVMVTPTLPLVAWKKSDPVVRIQGQEEHALHACWRYTFPFNLVGLPAITVPCGFANGLPVGLQIVGKPFAEATVLQVAQAYEEITSWHETGAPLGRRLTTEI